MSEIFTVNLPDIGEGVVEGEVVEWLKGVGDPLAQDEPVVIVMTDKATVELPAPHPGTLAKQYYKPGEIAILDKPLYDIEVKVLATPATRRIAKERGVDISTISGTGKEGRVTPEDLIGIRGRMATTMAESKRTIPHFSYFEEVDAARFVQLHTKIKKQAAEANVHATYMPLFIKALSLTIAEFPLISSTIDMKSKQVLYHPSHNIGIAMSTPMGLIVPVLKNAQDLSLEEVIRNFEELKEKAKQNKLQPSDMQNGTITISNYGVLSEGGLWATPIINPPEVAILAVNKIKKRPMVVSGEVQVRDVLNLSWSFDHRVIDGDLASRVSHFFAELIRNPAKLV